MTNYIKWNGLAEDSRDGDFKWGDNTYTWGDIQLVLEVAEVVSGRSATSRKRELEKWLKKDKDKEKNLFI